MARKRLEDKLNDGKKLLDDKMPLDTRRDGSKICHNGLNSSYNPVSFAEYANNGEFVMPKIFCLNFEQKLIDPNVKFLLFKNA
jgi:hypothetical protein